MNLMKNIKNGQFYAVKKINKSCKLIEEFDSINWERDIAKFLINSQCKNVIQFYKIIETIEHIYFIQEFIESGSLGQFIRKSKTCLPSLTVKEISSQIIEGNIPYNLNIDLWSLGIIIFYLQFTYLPFNINGKEHEQEIASKIVMNELIFPKKFVNVNDLNEENCNFLLQKIIEKCLV